LLQLVRLIQPSNSRQFSETDALLIRGWLVRHIMEDGCHEHKLPSFAKHEGTRIIYMGLL